MASNSESTKLVRGTSSELRKRTGGRGEDSYKAAVNN